MCARVQSINFLTHKSFTFLYFFLVQRKDLPFIPHLGGGVKLFFNCAMKGKDEVKKRETPC